jgi:hypothetical protein
MYRRKYYYKLKDPISSVNDFWLDKVNSNKSKISVYSDEANIYHTRKFPVKELDFESAYLNGFGRPKSIMDCVYNFNGVFIQEDFLRMFGELTRTKHKLYEANVYYKKELLKNKYRFLHIMPFDEKQLDIKNMRFHRFSVEHINEINLRFNSLVEYQEYNENYRNDLNGEFRYSDNLIFENGTILPEILDIKFNFSDQILFEKEIVDKIPKPEAKKVFDLNKMITVGVKMNAQEILKERNLRTIRLNKYRKSKSK